MQDPTHVRDRHHRLSGDRHQLVTFLQARFRRWRPFRHRSDVPLVMSAADMLVLPVAEPEPFGRVLIEAMACEVPAIGVDLGGVREVLTGEFTRFLCPPGEVDALTAALEALVSWREADPTLGRRCRIHVQRHFELGRVVAEVEGVLAEAAGTSSRPTCW